jgi:S-adenosylmethionine:tRNA ribosyltransferase-isomerase
MIFFYPNPIFSVQFCTMPQHPREIRIEDYDYALPENKIPLYPSVERGGSKLLVYKKGSIADFSFTELGRVLPQNALLVFNQSKVIPARMVMFRDTGARIEIFLLQPVGQDHQMALQSKKTCTWSCLVGGAKKWKENEELSVDLGNGAVLRASKMGRNEEYFEVCFEWVGSLFFADVIEKVGKIPLPPYIKRETTEEDAKRYQTVYAHDAGSVAAPTAGLHFTEELLQQLKIQGHSAQYITLHVGAGTFKPVSAERMEDHTMHTEQFVVSRSLIQALLDHGSSPVIPVGTTSMRTLESIYWLGAACFNTGETDWMVRQWQPYSDALPCTRIQALEALLRVFDRMDFLEKEASTCILIAPGYTFRICDGLVTNFHQPKSTLLLLVSALLGEQWKEVYSHALRADYRFLSYGDSSFLAP